MKKKFSLLVLLPAFMLSSCGDGAEVTDPAKLKETKDAISAKTKDIKNYEMTMKSSATSYDDSAKKNVTMESEMVFRANANEEMYLKSVSKEGDKKEESTIYLVKDAKYKQVLYLDMYDEETKKNEKTVYGYDGNELTFSFAALYFLARGDRRG